MPDSNFIASNLIKFPKGAVLVSENDPESKGMFLLMQGSVGVYKNFRLNDEIQIRVLSKGDFAGEYSLFLNTDHRESLVALSESVALVITRRNVNDFFMAQPDIAFNIVESLCRRLQIAEAELGKIKGVGSGKTAARKTTLFPKGHGSYELPLSNDHEALFEEKKACPMCGHNFTSLSLITTRLKLDRIDPDMRSRYKGIEPLYYEITTCPSCFFSAQSDLFLTASKKFAAGVNQKIGPHKLNMFVKSGAERDTFTVFAGYYLAILCASVCFDDYQMITASLWQKVSRLYQDCSDNEMFLYATGESLKNYLYSYEHFKIAERQIPQYLFVIGDLYSRTDDIDTARNYFYQAKTNKAITPQLKRQADLRLDELKEIILANKQTK